MSKDAKYTWGDTVVVDDDKAGAVCGIIETEDGFSYTVEYGDGTDELIAEGRLKTPPQQES